MASSRQAPTISVVTVVRNNLEGLITTASCLQSQSYSEIEHVVIDGASTDGTEPWLRSYAPSYRTTLVSEPDDGLYQAMNKGLAKATGDLVVFLNGGDSFSHENVLSFVATEWATGSWEWAYGAINYISAERAVLSRFELVPFDARRVQLGLTYVPHPATFMSRKLLNNLGGFRPEFGWSADQELGVRAALAAPPRVWSETLTDFLVGGAHSQGSLLDVSKRYSSIRRSNDVLLLRSWLMDSIYTELLGRYWSTRAWLSRRFKTQRGVDSLRSN